jgi:hypothetical protein
MEHITKKTIMRKWETIQVVEGFVERSRLEWKAPGLEVYLNGSFNPDQYAVAAKLVTYIADEMHIPQIPVRRQSKYVNRSFTTKTKGMF